jgi:hypothetical protein
VTGTRYRTEEFFEKGKGYRGVAQYEAAAPRSTCCAGGVHVVWRQRRSLATGVPAMSTRLFFFAALATLTYGPLPMDEYRVGLVAKLAVLLLFAVLVTLGIAAS